MSAFDCSCNPCAPTTIVQVPGSAGAAGTNGLNAFTVTDGGFVIPAKGGNTPVSVDSTNFMSEGMILYIGDAGFFQVIGDPSVSLVLEYLDIEINTSSGLPVSAGTKVTVSGPPLYVTPPAAFTDNTGGTATDTLAAGVGIQTLTFHFSASAIANGDLLTNYVPGYAFKILKVDARCVAPVTTAAKAATINMEIVSTDLTGGVILLSGLYSMGAAQAGSAVTGNNTGAATDSFSIEASSVTTFIEGAFEIIIELQNLDTVNAVASLAAKTNALITVLS